MGSAAATFCTSSVGERRFAIPTSDDRRTDDGPLRHPIEGPRFPLHDVRARTRGGCDISHAPPSPPPLRPGRVRPPHRRRPRLHLLRRQARPAPPSPGTSTAPTLEGRDRPSPPPTPARTRSSSAPGRSPTRARSRPSPTANDISAITGMGQGVTHVVAGRGRARSRSTTRARSSRTSRSTRSPASPPTRSSSRARARPPAASRSQASADDGTAFALDGGATLDHVTVTVPRAHRRHDRRLRVRRRRRDDRRLVVQRRATGSASTTPTRRRCATSGSARSTLPARARRRDARRRRPARHAAATATASSSRVATGATATATLRHATLVKRAGRDGDRRQRLQRGRARRRRPCATSSITGAGGTDVRAQPRSRAATASLDIAYSAYDPSRRPRASPGCRARPTSRCRRPRPGPTAYMLLAGLAAGRPRRARRCPAGAATTDLAGARARRGRRAPTSAPTSTRRRPSPISAPAGSGAAPERPARPAPAAPHAAGARAAGHRARPRAPQLAAHRAPRRSAWTAAARFAVRATCAGAPLGCRGTLKLTARARRHARQRQAGAEERRARDVAHQVDPRRPRAPARATRR